MNRERLLSNKFTGVGVLETLFYFIVVGTHPPQIGGSGGIGSKTPCKNCKKSPLLGKKPSKEPAQKRQSQAQGLLEVKGN